MECVWRTWKGGGVSKWSPIARGPNSVSDALANSEPQSPAAASFPLLPHTSLLSKVPGSRRSVQPSACPEVQRCRSVSYVHPPACASLLCPVHHVHGTRGITRVWDMARMDARAGGLCCATAVSKIPQPWMMPRESGVMRGDQGTGFIQACLPCRPCHHSTQNVVCSSVHSIGTSISLVRDPSHRAYPSIAKLVELKSF